MHKFLFIIGLFFPAIVFSQTLIVGRVIIHDGTPVSGVNVWCPEQNKGTSSDSTGYFELACEVPCTLEFSHVNYKKESYTLKDTRSPFIVILRNKFNNLREVVVTGRSTPGRLYSSKEGIEMIPAILGKPGIVCTPHLGASTPEAEDNCAAMAAQEISDYLKNGNITHSVNLPEVHQPRAGGKRICIIHKNEPGMISQITALTTEAGLNIENMVNKSKKNMAYTMLDATGALDGRLAEKLAAIPAVIRVRIL